MSTRIYTIGFTGRSARDFFGALRKAGVRRVVDVRLRNTSQLAGFAKRNDLAFFLEELGGIEYVEEPLLAPTPALLDRYRKEDHDWNAYAADFTGLMAQREVERSLDPNRLEGPAALLCSEPTAARCHRRLVLEYLCSRWRGLEAVHL